MKHITNREMGVYVTRREEFNNSKGSCYSRWVHVAGERLYVCLSYGDHHPLYIFSEATNTWYGNKTPNSQTTNRHRTLACPRGVEINWRTNDEMIDLATWGAIGLIQEKFRRAA